MKMLGFPWKTRWAERLDQWEMRAVSAQVRKLCQAAVSVRANRKKAVNLKRGTPVPLDFLITKGPRLWSKALVKSISQKWTIVIVLVPFNVSDLFKSLILMVMFLCRISYCNFKDSAFSIVNLTQSFGRFLIISFICYNYCLYRPWINAYVEKK